MSNKTKFFVFGEIYNPEQVSHNLYAKWFGNIFTFKFSNPIKKIKFIYKNINRERKLFINDYEFKNLQEEGWVELHFSNTTSILKCTCPTFNPYKTGHSTDNRDLGIYITQVEYTDILDLNYIYKINEIPCITEEISKIFNFSKTTGDNVYYHCGDYGDIIYALPVIKHTGGGTLYLGRDIKCEPDRCLPRESINFEKFKFLKSLLESQHYIKEVIFAEKYPENVTHDLNKFRRLFIRTTNQFNEFPNGSNVNLLDASLSSYDIDLSVKNEKWLNVINSKIINKKIVINRTERYHNIFNESDEAYKYVIKNYKNESVFVGTDREYALFIEKYGFVERYIVSSAEELAQLIDQAYLFVGNASFSFALSESLKKENFLEKPDDFLRHVKFSREGHNYLQTHTISKIKIPNIYHVVSLYEPKDLNTKERINISYKSWQTLYESDKTIIPVHVHEKDYPRNTKSVGDSRKCAFLKDLIKIGYDRCKNDDDIVMLTNDDTILSPFIGSKIFDKIVRYQACKSFRINLKQYTTHDNINIFDVLDKDGGRDMFAMTKRWIKKNIDLIPDYAMASTDWDFYLALLIQFTNGIWLSLMKNDQKCETDIELGHVYHIYHEPPWKQIKGANDYNSQLTKQFINKLGFGEQFKRIDYDRYKDLENSYMIFGENK